MNVSVITTSLKTPHCPIFDFPKFVKIAMYPPGNVRCEEN